MIKYIKTLWENGKTPVNALNLNKIEDAIEYLFDIIRNVPKQEDQRISNEKQREVNETTRQNNEIKRNDTVNKKVLEVDNTINEANTEMTNIENRFNAMSAEKQQDAEVIDARKGHASLGARLDYDLKEGEIIRETKEGEYLSFENTIKSIIQDIEIEGNTLQDASTLEISSSGILQEDGTYLLEVNSCNENLFDKNNIFKGWINKNNGDFVSDDTNRSSKYITLIPNSSYYLNATINGVNTGYALYDCDYKYIVGGKNGLIEAPSNAKYIRFCVDVGEEQSAQLTMTTQATPYVKHEGSKSDIILPFGLDGFGGVKDRVYFDKEENAWCVYKYIESGILSGDEKWYKYSNSLTNVAIFKTKDIVSVEGKEIMCDKFVWEHSFADKEHIFYNEWDGLLVAIEKNKLKTDDVAGFEEWLKSNNTFIKYRVKTPQKIVLPLNTQILLNSFANKTNAWVESGKSQVTLKATVSKSLASTVKDNTNEIVKINNKVADIDGLKESQDISYSTDKGFLACHNTKVGSVKDLVLKGRTLVNLGGKCNQNFKQYDVLLNSQRKLQTETWHTIIIKNKASHTVEMYLNENVFKSDLPTFNIQGGETKVIKQITKPAIEQLGLLKSSSITGTLFNLEVVVSEVDLTQNPPNYFEGLLNAGEDVSKIKGLTSNNNLFDESVLSSRLEDDGYYHFRTEGNTRANLFFGIVDSANKQITSMTPNTGANLSELNLSGAKVLIGVNGDVKDDKLLFPITEFNIGNHKIFKGCEFEVVDNNHIRAKNIFIQSGYENPHYIPHRKDEKNLLYKDRDGAWKPIPMLTEFCEADTTKLKWVIGGKKIIYNGNSNENWIVQSVGEVTVVFKVPYPSNSDHLKSVICDKFNFFRQAWDVSTNTEGISFDSNGNVYIQILKSKLESADAIGFKKWLQSNNVTVVYPIKQKEIYDIAPLGLDAYKDTTIVSFLSGTINLITDFKLTSNLANFLLGVEERVGKIEDYFYVPRPPSDGGGGDYIHPESHPAEMIVFTDGKNFQEKLNEGSLNGSNGSNGKTPNISIGTVETLAPGSDATVTKTGTTLNPVFNFGIPKGADGTSGGGSPSSMVKPRTTDTSEISEIFISKSSPAEFAVSGNEKLTVNGNKFTVGPGGEGQKAGGTCTATVSVAGAISLNVLTEGTRYYMIRTNIGGVSNSSSWLSAVKNYVFDVGVGDTVEIYFEDTATNWTGEFKGIPKNDLMWNNGVEIKKINVSSLESVSLFE